MNLPDGQKQHWIHVVIPFYNAERWIDRCLKSVHKQDHLVGQLHVHVIDDCSTDGSSERTQRLCHKYGFNYHLNDENQRCPRNIYEAIQRSGARPWDVIFLLDGDDYLPHGRVLSRVEEIFGEAPTWLMYGQYMSDPPDHGCAPAIPPPIDAVLSRGYRRAAGELQYFNHPLIFRRFLFDAIPIEELKSDDGEWLLTGYDRAIMIPMLELSSPHGVRHNWRFSNEVFYAYNSVNDTSEVFVRPNLNVDELFQRKILPPIDLSPQDQLDLFGITISEGYRL